MHVSERCVCVGCALMMLMRLLQARVDVVVASVYGMIYFSSFLFRDSRLVVMQQAVCNLYARVRAPECLPCMLRGERDGLNKEYAPESPRTPNQMSSTEIASISEYMISTSNRLFVQQIVY